MLQTTGINAVEIFSEGAHGNDFYSRSDLQAMVDAIDKLGFQPPIKLIEDGIEKRIFGAPALGYVSRIYRQGSKLLADLTGVPAKFAEIIKSRKYQKLGTEIFWQYRDECTGKTWPRVLRAVTFAVENLRLDSLAAIESMFTNSTAAQVYAEKREFRTYSQTEEPMNTNKNPQESLTERSKKFAIAALEFAVANELDFPTAVKELMRRVNADAKK